MSDELTAEDVAVILKRWNMTASAAFVRSQAAELERRHKSEDALRSLACWLSVGGYNALIVDAAEFERKIRAGVDDLVRVEVSRASGPKISDSEEMALLRRKVKDQEAELERQAELMDDLKQRWRQAEAELDALQKEYDHHLAGCAVGDEHLKTIGLVESEEGVGDWTNQRAEKAESLAERLAEQLEVAITHCTWRHGGEKGRSEAVLAAYKGEPK